MHDVNSTSDLRGSVGGFGYLSVRACFEASESRQVGTCFTEDRILYSSHYGKLECQLAHEKHIVKAVTVIRLSHNHQRSHDRVGRGPTLALSLTKNSIGGARSGTAVVCRCVHTVIVNGH